ncbi:unnamed protein product [Arctia plantaginis]|nr:unnamed protein product [Arctia plantaginis]
MWTQAIYDTPVLHRIPNITSLKSTVKRFPYEDFSPEDLEQLLCRCGIENPCVCTESPPEEEICQGKMKRRIFKGHVPTGLEERITVKDKNKCPPFYDVRVQESTAFYRGCKWSNRTSKRSTQVVQLGPGPTDYCLEKKPTIEEICAEKVRALKRKTCKQLRFIEKVQLQNILEGKPGPGTYSPEWPKGTNLQYLGPKAARFSFPYSVHPGPTDYWLRRDFDLLDPPEVFCQAKLPEPSCFGVKAKRFIPQKEQGPSPASYNTMYKPCQFVRCSTAPFGSSTVRFKADVLDDGDDEGIDTTDECPSTPEKKCPNPTWEFKSKTIRMKPLIKDSGNAYSDESPPKKQKKEKSPALQYLAPFNSSEGRFQPWYNNSPVHGKYETPGPCYYNLEIPKPLPAVNRGPLCRGERFPRNKIDTPAPNEYKVFGGIESILRTHNNRLRENIKNNIKFVWDPPREPESMTFEQREKRLIQKCIALLEPDVDISKKHKSKSSIKSRTNIEKLHTDTIDKNIDKPKMLRTFLYSHQMPNYF